mgnify:CR=1 FL=1|tara:strand:- start:3320 stop:4189 length:870 start_codon:yes stop_codon:yes gene_type:complete
MNILIFGVTGLLGNATYSYLKQTGKYKIFGVARNKKIVKKFLEKDTKKIFYENDILNEINLQKIFELSKPEVVINCAGLIKQDINSNSEIDSIKINSLFPHLLHSVCQNNYARLIHYSTDCVFDGKKGNYSEKDLPNCQDTYGRSKLMGEIINQKDALTLRTSIVGHELVTAISLMNWFLESRGKVKGFKKAYFSGLTSLEHAKVLDKFIIPKKEFSGLVNLAGRKINKYNFLCSVSEIYNHKINIVKEENFKIDRSLDASLFNKKTGYYPPPWDNLLTELRGFFEKKR